MVATTAPYYWLDSRPAYGSPQRLVPLISLTGSNEILASSADNEQIIHCVLISTEDAHRCTGKYCGDLNTWKAEDIKNQYVYCQLTSLSPGNSQGG